MILTQAQAQAVYGAMCALNNVGAKLKASFGDVSTNSLNAFESSDGEINVVRVSRYDVQEAEIYPDQADFARAYSLN